MNIQTSGQFQTFDLEIIQNNKIIKIKNNKVKLKRSPFYFRITLKGANKGIYVNVLDNSTIFNIPDNIFLNRFKNLPNKVMAESSWNNQKELIINDSNWHHWSINRNSNFYFYDKFSPIKLKDKIITYKSIEQIYFFDEVDPYSLPLNNNKIPDLNIVIITGIVELDELVWINDIMKFKIIWIR